MRTCRTTIVLLLALLSPLAIGSAAAQSANVAPTLIPVSGQLRTAEGQPRTGNVLLVISLYEGQADTAPRWIEHQQVILDATGRYDLNFGATRTDGLPSDLFSGDAPTRWLGVAVENEAEQPRVMLISVPYAAKAASADTLAGRAATDFVLSSTFREDVRAVIEDAGSSSGSSVGTNAVTLNFLQKGNGSGGTTDSTLFENGTNVGIGTTSPVSKVHIDALDIPTINLYSNSALRISSSDAVAANKGGSFSLGGIVGTDGQAGFAAMKGAKENGVGNNYDGYLMFATTKHAIGSREWMRITSDGYVGIGTSTPVAPLHVMGTNVATGNLYFSSSFRMSSADAFGADKGGSFSLGGTVNGGGTQAGYAAIKGAKENATADNYDGYLMFTTTKNGIGSREHLRITSGGSVGIGVTNPTAKLHVAGDVIVDGNIGAKYQDVAEWVDATEPFAPGSLVVIDRTASNRVTASTRSYDTAVAGAVSPQPGIILGERGPGKVLVAQSGRVKVKADTTNGPIRAGDLVVSSPTKGHVMRSKPMKVGGQTMHRPGTVVGKALEGLASGRGEILVLLTLQ